MAKMNIFGETTEERLESLISIVERMQRLQVGKGFLAAPDTLPISGVAAMPIVGDTIIEYFFPVNGSIAKVVSFMGGARTVTVSITLMYEGSQQQTLVTFGDGKREADVDIDVKAGTFLEVRLTKHDPVAATLDRLGIGVIFNIEVVKEKMKKLTYEQLDLTE